jgi:AraC family transcriptional regulator, regulatory protein of adaptative response / methylphosphotriester-DNA alkyltransferase methyltransferase
VRLAGQSHQSHGVATRQLGKLSGLKRILLDTPFVEPVMPQQRSTTVRLRTSLFEEAAAIVSEEYERDLALDEIARRVASSRRQLQRAYAEIGHTTFRSHLTAVRMVAAAELLARGPMTVREVAHRVGYRQPAQFAKAFRRHHGMSPSSYRARRRLAVQARPPIRAAA